MGNRRLTAIEHAGEVSADDAIPLVVGHLGNRHADANTRVVERIVMRQDD